MSGLASLFWFVLAVFIVPPLIGGLCGASVKFPILYAVAVTLFGYFARIMNYLNDGKADRGGMPSVTDYALSQIVITIVGSIAILALCMVMWWIGTAMRKPYRRSDTRAQPHGPRPPD